MAMTATISLSPSTVLINQPVNAALTVSNSGGAAVTMTSIVPLVYATGLTAATSAVSCGIGEAPLGPGQVISVPASGSVIFPFSVVFFAPSTGPIGAGNGTFSIGAACQSNDGSNFAPTAATVTVNPIALPTTEQ